MRTRSGTALHPRRSVMGMAVAFLIAFAPSAAPRKSAPHPSRRGAPVRTGRATAAPARVVVQPVAAPTAPPPVAATTATLPGTTGQLAEGARLLASGDAAAALVPLASAAADRSAVRDLALVLLGRAQLAAGRPADALASAEEAATAVPDSVRVADAAFLRAQTMAALSRPEAADAFASFAHDYPRDSRATAARIERAKALVVARNAPEAASAWRSLAIESPNDAPADALEKARTLAVSAGVPFVEPSRAELVQVASRLSAANLHDRAEKAWFLAGRGATGPAAAKAALQRARSLYALRRTEEARAACEGSLRHSPEAETAGDCRVLLARAAWRLGDLEGVLATTRAGIADPRLARTSARPELRSIRAGALAERDRWSEATAEWKKLVAESPASDRATEARWRLAWTDLRQGRFDEAESGFRALAASRGSSDLGRPSALWAAVAAERAGRDPSDALAALYLQAPWTYTGALARELLAPRATAERLAELDAQAAGSGVAFQDPGPLMLGEPHGTRYVLLRNAGIDAEALPEIETMSALSGRDKALAFELAQARARAGRAGSAEALLRATFPDAVGQPSRRSPTAFWKVVYPLPFEEIVLRKSAQHGLDAGLCSAIIRSESGWDPDARSPSDARGLMQLVPATGKRLAAEEQMAAFDPDRLFDPAVNVDLGARYLAQLVSLFKGDEAAAAGAYNAGEDKVQAWWADFDKEGVALRAERIERMPYKETRGYVKRVLEAASWYRWILASDAASGIAPAGLIDPEPVSLPPEAPADVAPVVVPGSGAMAEPGVAPARTRRPVHATKAAARGRRGRRH